MEITRQTANGWIIVQSAVVKYPARRSCIPTWAVPTDVRDMLDFSWITDLHLMLLHHCKNGGHKRKERI
jgi:hypothetical protein